MDFEDFLREVAPLLGLSARKYRRRSARRRLDDRIRELGLRDYRGYLERVRVDADEAQALPERMRVTVSRFFREASRWEQLAGLVLPELLVAKGGTGALRVWSAGCCCGEEPYTLAVLWLERFAPTHPEETVDILATDIDEVVLARAQRAAYEAGSLREVPPVVRSRWFCRSGPHWRLRPRAVRLVRFAHHNLMVDPVPQNQDLVLCRYLAFTYYRGDRRHRAACRLWEGLRPGGALMIGRKEGLTPGDLGLFEPWPGAEGVFRKR